MTGSAHQRLGRYTPLSFWVCLALLLSACAAPVPNNRLAEVSPIAPVHEPKPGAVSNQPPPILIQLTTQSSSAAVAEARPSSALSAPVDQPLPEPVDLWSRMRLGFKLPTLEHPRVDSFKKRFQASRYFHQKADRVRLLLPLVVAEVERQGLPMELALIPLVESALNCHATSSAAAHGCWQFMPLTAKDHDLVISALVDQRRDVLRSTLAGLGYLSTLERQTGDWFLAMSAYNWGVGRVLRLKNQALARGEETDFIALMRGMPVETQNYAPQVEALKRIIVEANPEDLPEASALPALQPVEVRRDMDVALVARLARISEAELLRMNPAVQRPIILAAAVPELLLTDEAAERFNVALRQHVGPTSSWKLVRVNGRQTVAHIASAQGISADLIREVNRIPKGMKPTSGSTLLLPAGVGGAQERVSPELVETARRQWAPEIVRIWVKARRNETLAAMASRLNLSVKQLVVWNPKLAQVRRLSAGQRVLVLVTPELGERLAAMALPAVR